MDNEPTLVNPTHRIEYIVKQGPGFKFISMEDMTVYELPSNKEISYMDSEHKNELMILFKSLAMRNLDYVDTGKYSQRIYL